MSRRSAPGTAVDVAAGGKRNVKVLTSTLAGGTGTHLMQVMNLLSRRATNVEILSEGPPSNRISPQIEISLLPRTGRFNGYPWTQFRRLRALLSRLSDRDTDVTHAYFFWPIIYGRILKLSGLTRVLVENREDEGFDWGRHEYLLLRATRHLPDAVICVSEAVAAVVREREGIDEDRLRVIHNGVELSTRREDDASQVLRHELGIPDDAEVVGMVANYDHRIKGAAEFVRSIPLILAECPRTHFVLVGEGRLRDEIESLAEDLGVREFLHLPGFRPDVDSFYELMSVSVLTSLSEGFSITLLESMSRGVPVVVTRVGGNAEVVRDGESGFLVPPGEITPFAESVSRLLLDSELRNRIGDAARSTVEQRYSISATAERYAALYDELLAASR